LRDVFVKGQSADFLAVRVDDFVRVYTTQLAGDKGVPMSKRDIHVLPRDGGWAVRREGASRDSSRYDRKDDAMDAARETGRRERVEVVEHGRNGRIQDSDSYGHDPHPPIDRKH
jgi:hypothetical protein